MAREFLAALLALENSRVPGDIDANYKGKVLQFHFKVEDDRVFTTPWGTLITYRCATGGWPEVICAENRQEPVKKATIPTATSRISEKIQTAM